MWQFVLAMIIVRREAGDLRWTTIKRRLRLNTPLDPATSQPRSRLWLWVIPFVAAIVVWEVALGPYVTRLWISIFPLVAEPPGKAALATDRGRARSAHVALGDGRIATVTLDPGRHGPVTVTVALSPGPKPQRLTATAALPDKQLGPITIPLSASGAEYSASGVVLPSAGRWTITLTVRTSEFDSVVADTKIRLY